MSERCFVQPWLSPLSFHVVFRFPSPLLIAAAVATGITASLLWRVPSAAVTEVDLATRPAVVPSQGYMTSAACVRCHFNQHSAWHASYHRTMTQTLTAESAPATIEDATVVVAGDSYRFLREGERYYVTFDDPLVPGVGATRRQLVLMTGSHHMHVFWYESPIERTPALLPIVYLLDDQRWIPRKSAFVRPPGSPPGHELGRWNSTCSGCHSTHPRGRFNEATRQWDTHVSEFGIACEACHGPGEDHIRFYDGDATAKADDVVVNPEDLPHHLQSDVCGQCHSVHVFYRQEYGMAKVLAEGMPYRPGDDLEASELRQFVRAIPELRETEAFRQASGKLTLENVFWADGTVRVSGREYSGLVESPCFQAGQLSCLSCHEMHASPTSDLTTWRDDQLMPGMRTNDACTQCHQEAEYTDQLTSHTHHASDSSGSECMNCHMPPTTYGLLKTIRSHRIESPSAITTLETGRPNGCVTCHLDETIRWAADHLSEWYDQPQLQLNPLADETAVGVINMIRGDAGLRAVHAALFGWEPAREASGTAWMVPLLLIASLDEYDAVRLIAQRTLRTIPGWEQVQLDEFADPQQRQATVNRYLAQIQRELRLEPNPQVLIGPDGAFQFDRAFELFQGQDRRPVMLDE